jgi:hypothetical protein
MNGFQTRIVRSNQNAVMFYYPFADKYAIVNVRSGEETHFGTLNACKKAWNRNYANSRQYVSPNGVNHRFMAS